MVSRSGPPTAPGATGYGGSYTSTAAIPESPASKETGWWWYAIGGVAAVAVLAGVLGFLFLGKASSSKFSSVSGGIDVASDDGQSLAAGSGPAKSPTTEVVATVVDGVWPVPASWATSRCAGKDYNVVTSLETAASRVAICTDDPSGGSSASYFYTGYGKNNHLWSPWLDADYDEAGQQFVATSPGDTPTTYTVSPTTLAIRVGDGAPTFEFSSEAVPRGSVSDDDLLAQLVSLMTTSGQGRIALTDLSDGTWGNQSCMSSADATDLMDEVVANRSALDRAAAHLKSLASGTTVETAANDFAEAMSSSLSVDQTIASWVSDVWAPYADGGCAGGLPTNPIDASPDTKATNDQATAAKTSTADEVNVLAADTSLKHDWTVADF